MECIKLVKWYKRCLGCQTPLPILGLSNMDDDILVFCNDKCEEKFYGRTCIDNKFDEDYLKKYKKIFDIK